MLKKLSSSYLLDGKLLFGMKELLGFDPYISPGFKHNASGHGTKIKVAEFDLNGKSFTVILMHNFRTGPASIRTWIEILEEGTTLIRFETGGSMLGNSYRRGDKYKITNGRAFYLANGFEMIDPETELVYNGLTKDAFYLLWFKEHSIPLINKNEIPDLSQLRGKTFSEEELEPYRQIEWHANVEFHHKKLQFTKSSIPGFFMKNGESNGTLTYEVNDFFPVCSKLEVKEL